MMVGEYKTFGGYDFAGASSTENDYSVFKGYGVWVVYVFSGEFEAEPFHL